MYLREGASFTHPAPRYLQWWSPAPLKLSAGPPHHMPGILFCPQTPSIVPTLTLDTTSRESTGEMEKPTCTFLEERLPLSPGQLSRPHLKTQPTQAPLHLPSFLTPSNDHSSEKQPCMGMDIVAHSLPLVHGGRTQGHDTAQATFRAAPTTAAQFCCHK